MRLLLIPALLASCLTFSSQASDAKMKEPIIHQIYQLVDQRNAISPVFQQALAQNQPKIQKAALLGLARIGGTEAIEQVLPFLNHPNSEFRQLAALALGISQHKPAAKHLWQQLKTETDTSVKKEIYFGLGNLGNDGIVNRMLARWPLEKNQESQAHLFQGLSMALTFHRQAKNDFEKINYKQLIDGFAKGDQHAAIIGFFLNRIPNIEKYITAEQLLSISKNQLSTIAQVNLARLVSKITKDKSQRNRELLAWVIEKSESDDLGLQLEAIRAYQNYVEFPQALIQLGKLQASSNPIVAQTALSTLANSELESDEIIRLLKGKLKSDSPALVVEAISGLVKRQTKDQMSWVVKLFNHPNTWVKINLISLLKNKSDTEFDNLIKFFSKDSNRIVAEYAQKQLQKQPEQQEKAASVPAFSQALEAASKKVLLKTSEGDITLQLLADAPFTSWHFINNIKKGFIEKSYFSRVIGNFVAQGGDTSGDKGGSSGETIREEINLLGHEPMTVGMATLGKDTGSSQFFINTARNLHLDRNYTVFAKVIEGEAVAMRITNGAQILKVKVLD